MQKLFLVFVLVLSSTRGNASSVGNFFSNLTMTVINRTSMISANLNAGINDVTAGLKMKITDVISNAITNANDSSAGATMMVIDHDSQDENVITAAVTAARNALNEVALFFSNLLKRRPLTTEIPPEMVSQIVSAAETAAIRCVSEDAPVKATSLTTAIINAVTSATNSSTFLRGILNILTRLTTVFTTFITNASSDGVVTALRESFLSNLDTLSKSVMIINN